MSTDCLDVFVSLWKQERGDNLLFEATVEAIGTLLELIVIFIGRGESTWSRMTLFVSQFVILFIEYVSILKRASKHDKHDKQTHPKGDAR